ncbi:MAG: hypothetical protein WC294_05705 [Methanoregula sp.]
MVIPACATDTSSSDALTRGSQFTVTITGAPNTAYYLWLTRTSTLTGNPGDQPPVIVGGQSSVQKDTPGGPYTIGMYAFNNGNGRTIIDDVAPSTPGMSNTNYYALVTTDRDGRAVVAFQTSSGTATRTFSIKAENPQSSATVFIERGLPVRMPVTPTITPSLHIPTIPPSTFPTTIPTTNPLPTTLVLTTESVPVGTPSQRSPSGVEVGILAIIAGLGLKGKKKFSR